MKITLTLLLAIQLGFLSASSTGSITGSVIDADTHQPLIGANVMLTDTELGSASNAEGKFSIRNIPVGSYTISISMIGYESVSRANVNIYSQRQTPLKFYLHTSVLQGKTVKVTAGFFEKAKDGIVSTQTFGIEEIRSDPVGVYDIQMMVHALPSVITATDQNNEIIVRGGGPGENLFIMDNLEIPNPNHFGEVGTGGGPVNILNTEFVEQIDFFAGGFPARYGDKQSSVMDISLREGNYDNFESEFELSMGGAGLLVEGPLANGKASYIASFRQAFLKYIIKSAGLAAIPEYWNSQMKAVYNIDSRNKLIFNAVGGSDKVEIVDESRPDMKGAENIDYSGYQYTTGITYKSLFSKKGYSLFTIGNTTSNWIVDVYDKNNGIKETYFSRDNIEFDNFIKGDVVYKISPSIELSAGINTKYGQYKMLEDIKDDMVFFYNYPELESGASLDDYYDLIDTNTEYEYYDIPEPATGDTIINKGLIINNNGGIWKYAAYSQMKLNWHPFTLTAGLRFDKVPYNSTSVISPRLGASLSITPGTKLNAAFGSYYQTPYYWMLMNPNNAYPLKHSYTKQQILGIEHLFADDIKGTLEVYNKTYHQKPVYIADTTPDSLDDRLGFTDIGEGRARGLEIFLQKKFARKWYGTLSYSYSNAEGVDPRPGKGDYYPWDFDFENVFTLVGGYKFKFRESPWYQHFRESIIFPYISWIPFMVSDQLELSFRYSYSGGRPYTPKVYDFHHRVWYIDSNAEYNTERFDYYSRLDVMILRRFNFKRINLTTYLDLQNIFDRNNEWDRVYLDDGTYEMSYQYKQLPVGGIIIEF
ncbi:MAG: TonB-dependent receptor [Candidatus Marinimicrobia bacterium]|nr:TonB-dependent receptor [Candidatus Neomarinimicrobiota bacterium]